MKLMWAQQSCLSATGDFHLHNNVRVATTTKINHQGAFPMSSKKHIITRQCCPHQYSQFFLLLTLISPVSDTEPALTFKVQFEAHCPLQKFFKLTFSPAIAMWIELFLQKTLPPEFSLRNVAATYFDTAACKVLRSIACCSPCSGAVAESSLVSWKDTR